MFKSTDFERWNYSHRLHDHKNTGMWECPDFYPVKVAGKKGLDPSTVGPHVRHVLKISSDDHKHDYYSVGKYLVESDTYEPENSAIDTGAGLRYDYGKYYASKTFFDPHTSRRILYGWTNESDSTVDDVAKGWACIQVPTLNLPQLCSYSGSCFLVMGSQGVPTEVTPKWSHNLFEASGRMCFSSGHQIATIQDAGL